MTSFARCLVTGGAGFVGSALVRALAQRTDVQQVVSLDDYSSGSEDNHVASATYVRASTTSVPEALPEGFVPTIVFHFGEFSRVVLSLDDPLRTFLSNQYGTACVARYAAACGAKLVYSGSTAMLGNAGADQHLNPYAWTKAKNVELLRNFATWYDLEYACCYFYNVFGPGQIRYGPYATVVGIFEEQAARGEPLTVVSPGTQTRAFTHIADIVKGVLLVAEHGQGDDYLLGTDENISIMDLAKLFEMPYTMVAARRGERTHSCILPSRARTELGWAPTQSVRDYIRDVRRDALRR